MFFLSLFSVGFLYGGGGAGAPFVVPGAALLPRTPASNWPQKYGPVTFTAVCSAVDTVASITFH